ncbi:uncharacterized protein F4807DRAFT_454807 [Annulohypoxylon truncatum]|uniref:uncharacterized protein n=1 Tax=Annulohypoxylon truncatum TaxID=327061 RepID=UPI0020082B89|nr:uncharacterized protein F4807DRAFT_454807 [Annulohypoxylon truncatum]KAI1204206.1 hypothetical protein F4807DRAFT_454807 [Annulohypoxylon truncatum]
MHTTDYGFLTVGQQLLSPNSTGHSYDRRHPLHRCYSYGCKSAPTEQHGKENSREYEDEHWLFSPKPHRFHLRLATSGACSYCKTRRTPEDCRDRSLTPERSAGDDLISVWLSGVSCIDCPNEEANLTDPSTPATPKDSGNKPETVSSLTYPKIVLQPARRDCSTAQSGTGLDGPQSSESDEISKLREGLSELKESSQSADLSMSSQKLDSNTSGSIEWNKNWEKRKPRRKHDVSEVSDSNFIRRPRTADIPARGNDVNATSSDSASEGVSDDKSCAYPSQHDAQYHAIKKFALNSCPELHRQLDDFDKSLAGPRERDHQEQIAQLRSELEKVRHRHHFHVRNIITRRFQFLTRRPRRSGSSTFSVQSENPARRRRNSKERRLLARESVDVWPSSGEESPLFNTPESNITHADTPRAAGHHFDPLAMASMMIATAELDRLSLRASLEHNSRTSGSSTGFSGSMPISPEPLYSGAGSLNDEASISEPTALYSPPTIPHNTPTPLSRPPHRKGHRRRAQRSHLSEVTTPEDIASPEEYTEEFESRSSVSSSLIEPLPECSAIPDGGHEDNLYPKPLSISRNSREEARPTDDTISGETQYGLIGLNRAGTISAPARVSSIGKPLESMYSQDEISRDDGQSLPTMSFTSGHAVESPTDYPDPKASEISMGTCDDQRQTLDSDVPQAATASAFNEGRGPESCHPDTWSESQGEPGDSDPFCPSDCLEIRRSIHDGDSRPLGLVRRETSETVCKVDVVKEETGQHRD